MEYPTNGSHPQFKKLPRGFVKALEDEAKEQAPFIFDPEGTNSADRAELPELLIGVPHIYCDPPRPDGTIKGMISVDGIYDKRQAKNPERFVHAYSPDGNEISPQGRQIRTYDVETESEALSRAKDDGLVQGILIEVSLGEPEPCTLGQRKPTRETLEQRLRIVEDLRNTYFGLSGQI